MTRKQTTVALGESVVDLSLHVNGHPVERSVSVRLLLSDFLRHNLGLTGTHVGCEQGVCGSCTVIIDDQAARACLTLAAQANGTRIRTIESVAAPDGTLHPLQQALLDRHAVQCGFCTPGIVMGMLGQVEDAALAYAPDEDIRCLLAGHLCRCTGYQSIVDAIREAARTLASPNQDGDGG